ncbi:MAG: 3-isopropylmalate dehydratase large subunit [Rickettsiales bacterium]|jgi:3-isopropylmalate/(R)-2-methylmalate dehydratase large subunit|nr:3-isopropylmalate dehydratase large subunit [Rickettsiales bacterium]
MTGKTLYDKIWESHVVEEKGDGTTLLYVDRHLMHEITPPVAYEDMDLNGYKPRNPSKALAVEDHVTHTKDISKPYADEIAREELEYHREHLNKYGIEFHPAGSLHGGICHAVAPELGFAMPGVTLTQGDSHTATHGAMGALAFGTGTTEIEQVLVTQTVTQRKMKNMKIVINGDLPRHSTGKDIILYVIGKIGTKGGTGYAVEFMGDTIENLSMDGRLTVSNMGIEAGARVNLIAPDEKTFAYIKGAPWSPKGEMWDKAVAYWKTLKSDVDAKWDAEYEFNAEDIVPQITWGTSPEDVIPIDGVVPDVGENKKRALEYIGIKSGDKIEGLKVDRVFIGACTNGRLDDLKAAAEVLKGRKVADGVKAIVVPGTNFIKKQAEDLGIAQIFIDAGFEWRWAGCSLCLGMNEDRANGVQRIVSTSNRNFENRQGDGARTHLVSPAMAAIAAVTGKITDIRNII